MNAATIKSNASKFKNVAYSPSQVNNINVNVHGSGDSHQIANAIVSRAKQEWQNMNTGNPLPIQLATGESLMGLIQSALDQIGWLLIGTDANNFIMPSSQHRIMPNIVVHERHHDEVIMTEQPVEIGAAITDHSFRNPSRLRLVYGYSNSCLKAIFKDFEDGYGLLQHGLVNFWGRLYKVNLHTFI